MTQQVNVCSNKQTLTTKTINSNFFLADEKPNTVFRRVLYAVFFLQLQCKKFNAYNITDHLTFCCCRNPGRKNLSRENI